MGRSYSGGRKFVSSRWNSNNRTWEYERKMLEMKNPISGIWQWLILASAAVIVVAACLLAAGWGFADTVAEKSESVEISEIAVDLDPLNPRTHFSLARQLENTFDPEAISRSLSEYEIAVALAPKNYIYWLSLGRARERAGMDGEPALRQAMSLAPHYSRVRWALGNALIRKGKIEEGFAEIRYALESDEQLAPAAAALAWELTGGDVKAAIALIGSEPLAAAEIVARLANDSRFDDAFDVFSSLSAQLRSRSDFVAKLAEKFIAAKRFRQAAQIVGAASADGAPRVGAVTNAGFESDMQLGGASVFDWRLSAGPIPQIARTDATKTEGNYSLVMVFPDSASAEFREISQTVAVEPTKRYRLRFSFRSELRTDAAFRWEIVSAADSKRLAVSEPLSAGTDWTAAELRFQIPGDIDGVTLRLRRENCRPTLCKINGKIWFDDFRLNEEN